MKIFAGFILGMTLLASFPAAAERGDREHGDRRFENHGIQRHNDRDMGMDIWRGGRWHHGRHEGRIGWWWIAGGAWYFYPERVYPYPDPYVYAPPVTVINQPAPVVAQQVLPQPPVQVIQQQPSPVLPPQQPSAQFWHYCDSAKGYYPYVAECPEGWKSVPARAPQGTPVK